MEVQKPATVARPVRDAFVKRMVGIGVPVSRSKRLANTFWALARPESFGKVIDKTMTGRRKKVVYSVRVPDRGVDVCVSKSSDGLVIGGSAKTFSFGSKKRALKAHKTG